jgi:PAS domain-containing protein
MPAEEYASVRALAEQRRVENVEMGVRRPDGATRWLNVAAEPFDQGEAGVVIVYSDITERRRAELALKVANERLAGVVESAGDMIATMDTRHRYTLFNPAFRDEFWRIFGVDLEPGDSMPEALAHLPEDLAHAMAYWNRALAGGGLHGHAAVWRRDA